MIQPVIRMDEIKPLEGLRLRPRGAYGGTITAPGDLVSDGKVLFARERVGEEGRMLARRVAGMPDRNSRAVVPQAQAADVFKRVARQARKQAEVLGQVGKPAELPAPELDNLAVLRYGRGGSIRYVFLDAYRLLLMHHLVQPDEILCTAPQEPVLFRRGGVPVGVITALRIEPEIRKNG